MRFEYNEDKRVLIALEYEVFCKSCNEKDWQKLHYCQQNEVLYCVDCLWFGKACIGRWHEHTDFKLDEVRIVTPEKENTNLRMNKEVLNASRSGMVQAKD